MVKIQVVALVTVVVGLVGLIILKELTSLHKNHTSINYALCREEKKYTGNPGTSVTGSDAILVWLLEGAPCFLLKRRQVLMTCVTVHDSGQLLMTGVTDHDRGQVLMTGVTVHDRGQVLMTDVTVHDRNSWHQDHLHVEIYAVFFLPFWEGPWLRASRHPTIIPSCFSSAAARILCFLKKSSKASRPGGHLRTCVAVHSGRIFLLALS
ncbi:hypothetical protein Hamer_G025391 [Homarus americanus]|uniref:Uncharacterized protein n=1 Tax=Homarus americanus TaxID=6706 RepID=A0A8J5JD26_HOMAM|nr:hypothetical protein Hamer_G025391 [Homarus americanus]